MRCEGQYEIDLLDIDPVTLDRYHIEKSDSGSQNFSRLTTTAEAEKSAVALWSFQEIMREIAATICGVCR